MNTMFTITPMFRHYLHVGKTMSKMTAQLPSAVAHRLRTDVGCPTGSIHLGGKIVGYPSGRGWLTFYGAPVACGRDIKEFFVKRVYRIFTKLRNEAEELKRLAWMTASGLASCTGYAVASSIHRYTIKVAVKNKKVKTEVVDRTESAIRGSLPAMLASSSKLTVFATQFARHVH